MTNWHLDVLPPAQRELWKKLSASRSHLAHLGFYLAGGTALALQIGHRQSVDFDFFSQQKNTAAALVPWLDTKTDLVVRDRDADTFHIEWEGVFISFIGAYKYPLITSPVGSETELPVASLTDIGLMKLHAIQDRASIRDYLDLAIIFRDYLPLRTLLDRLSDKYGPTFNPLLSLRALASWQDINEEMPVVLDVTLAAAWKKIIQEQLVGLSEPPSQG